MICKTTNKIYEIINVNMANQRITELNIDDFLTFPLATKFDFSANKLEKVSGFSMGRDKDFIKIEALILGQNPNLQIEDGSFDGLFSLKEIDLHGSGSESYTSLSWAFCHSKSLEYKYKMQENANVYFDYSKDSKIINSNERSYCKQMTHTGKSKCEKKKWSKSPGSDLKQVFRKINQWWLKNILLIYFVK